MTDLKLGFIGLGAMGGALAHQLLKAKFALWVWGRTPSKLKPWLDAGAQISTSPAELARHADIVFLCVTDTVAVEDVVFADNGVIEGAGASMLVVDHSTIHPLATVQYAEQLRTATGTGWIDAPVTGGVVAAEAGSLVIMAGGEAPDLARVRPILEHYSQRVTYMGANGAGQATKIANQMIIGGNVAVAAEALNYAANFGVSAASLPEALAGGWADSAVLQNHARRMAAADYTLDVDAAIMAKDIDIACDMGRETGSPMPVTALVQQLYRQLIADGDRDKGQIGLMWLYKQKPL